MISKLFLDSPDYQTFKHILADILMNKPVDFVTKGKSNEVIAREVEARVMAVALVNKAIKKFEAQAKNPMTKKETFR